MLVTAGTNPEVEVGPGSTAYAAIISLHGEHDLATLATVESALGSITGNVLVDLSDCDFLDITVAGALRRRADQLAHELHRLDLVVPLDGSDVGRTLELMGMTSLATVHHGRSPRTRRAIAVTNLTFTRSGDPA